jgi:alpha-tubulin suppressor-like RCC1 family protein
MTGFAGVHRGEYYFAFFAMGNIVRSLHQMVVGCRVSRSLINVKSLNNSFITMIGAGRGHTMAGDSDGRLYGWGWNRVSVMCYHSLR